MAQSNLTVSISADITDLKTKMAQAQVAYNAANAELNKFARAAQKAGEDITKSLNPAVAEAATKAAFMKAEVNKLSAEFTAMLPKVEAAGKAHEKVGGVLSSNRLAFMELGHSARAMADSLASGADPLRVMGQQFPRIAQSVLEFNTVSLATVARFGAIGVAAAAAGAAVFALQGYFENLTRDRALASNLQALGSNLTFEGVRSIGKTLRDAGYDVKAFAGLEHDARDAIIRDLDSMKYGSESLDRALAEMAPNVALTFGTDAQGAVKLLKEGMLDLSGAGAKTLESMRLSDDELARFQKLASEDPKRGMIVFLNDVKMALDRASEASTSLRQRVGGDLDFLGRGIAEVREFGRLAGNIGTDIPVMPQSQLVVQQNKKTGADLKAAESELPNNIAPDRAAISNKLEQIGADFRKSSEEINKEKATYLRKLLDTDRFGLAERAALEREYSSIRLDILRTGSSEELELIRTNALKAAATAGARRTSEITAQKQVLEQGLNDEKLSGDAKIELRKQLAQLELRDVRAVGAETKKSTQEVYREYVAGIEEKLAEDKGNFAAQIALVKEWVAKAKAEYGEDSANYSAAKHKLADIDNERTAYLEQQGQKRAEIARNMANAQANLQRIGAKPEKGEFDASISLVFDDSEMRAKVAEQIGKLRTALETELRGLQTDIHDKLNLPTPDISGATAAYAKETEIVAAYADKVAALNQRAADATEKAWEKITEPVGHAFDSILGAAFSANGKIGISVAKAAEGVVLDWAKSDLKVAADWGASELRKTLITTTQTGARSAVGAAGNASTIVQLGSIVAKFLGFETAKTAAADAGAGARAATEAAATAAGTAARIASNVATVTGDAGVAAAGAYAATAAIPIVGPALAPGAAATALAGTLAYLPIASAAGGWDRVPADGAPAILHKNEMVLPAHLAEGVRKMSAGGVNLPRAAPLGGNARGGDVTHSQTFNHSPTINAPGAPAPDMRAMMRQANSEFKRMAYETSRNWAGTGSQNLLPGR